MQMADVQIDVSSFRRPDSVELVAHARSYESSYLSKVHPANGPRQLKTESYDVVFHPVDSGRGTKPNSIVGVCKGHNCIKQMQV